MQEQYDNIDLFCSHDFSSYFQIIFHPPNVQDAAKLSGTLPPELSILTGLTILKLGDQNHIVQSIPKDYSKFVDLKILDLDKNNLTGPFPQELSSLSELESLDINFNRFSGGIEFLSSYKKLKVAHLDNNYFQGTIPESLGEMTELRKFVRMLIFCYCHGFCLSNTNQTNYFTFLMLYRKIAYRQNSCAGASSQFVIWNNA